MEGIAILEAKKIEAFTQLLPTIMEEYKRLAAAEKANKENLRLLSLEEISQLWGFEKNTVSQYLKAYRVKAVQFTDKRSLRYRAKDIEEILNKLQK